MASYKSLLIAAISFVLAQEQSIGTLRGVDFVALDNKGHER